MRLSIATKIFIAFAFLVLTFTGVLAFGVYRTQSLFSQLERLNRRIVPVSLSLSDAQTDLKSFDLLLNERDPLVIRRTLQVAQLGHSLPDRIRKRVGEAHEMMARSRLSAFDTGRANRLREVQRRLEELDRRTESFARLARKFTDRVLREEPAASQTADSSRTQKLQSDLRDDARQIGERISSLRSRLRDITDRALDRADQNERSSLFALAGLSLGALLLAVGVLFAILRVVRPLGALTDAAKRIGEGDYRPIEDLPDHWFGRDEITLLAEEFNSMAEKLARRDDALREQHRALLKSERLATVGRMTSAITHELRNPLSSINLNSEILRESLLERGIDPEDSEIMPPLETIIEEVDRLHDITEEYLVYARLPSSELELENLSNIVRDLVDFHRTDWERQGVSVELETPDRPVEVRADANQLRQALLNIVKNAVEASPDGADVGVEVRTREETAAVRVSDEGPGIDPEIEQQLFEPFETTKPDGTGLGLAMTQRIVEEHHGEVRIESLEEGGARFVVELPRGDEVDSGAVVEGGDGGFGPSVPNSPIARDGSDGVDGAGEARAEGDSSTGEAGSCDS